MPPGQVLAGHSVGEDHLTNDAVAILLGVAHLVVPVAQAAVVAQVAEGVAVIAPPCIEVLAEPRI
jgi:hypothetical protein